MRARRHLLLLLICLSQSALAHGALGADLSAKIEQINEREKQLIEKLDAVRQRERYIESQLEQVRQRKQELLSKQAGKPVQAPGGTPPATPGS